MTHHELDPELSDRLRAERPELSAGAFDAQRARLRSTAPSAARRSSSVLAAGLLGMGVVFCGSGSALAVSGFAGDGSAVARQYAPAAPQGGVAGTTAENSAPPLGAPTTPPESGDAAGGGVSTDEDQMVAGTSAANGTPGTPSSATPSASSGASAPSAAPASSVTRQVAAVQTSGSLPYTGFAAIPVLLIGAALLIGGALMRRRTGPVT